MVQVEAVTCCRDCGARLPVQQTGRPRIRCDTCKRKFEQKRQHEQYLKRKFKGLSDAERHLEELKADVFRGQRQVLRHQKWFQYHLKHKFACSPGDVRKARQMLRNIEEKHQFLGAPLDQRRKGRVSS